MIVCHSQQLTRGNTRHPQGTLQRQAGRLLRYGESLRYMELRYMEDSLNICNVQIVRCRRLFYVKTGLCHEHARLKCCTPLIGCCFAGHGHVGAQPVGRVELPGPGHVPGDGVVHSSRSPVHPGEVASQRVRRHVAASKQLFSYCHCILGSFLDMNVGPALPSCAVHTKRFNLCR